MAVTLLSCTLATGCSREDAFLIPEQRHEWKLMAIGDMLMIGDGFKLTLQATDPADDVALFRLRHEGQLVDRTYRVKWGDPVAPDVFADWVTLRGFGRDVALLWVEDCHTPVDYEALLRMMELERAAPRRTAPALG